MGHNGHVVGHAIREEVLIAASRCLPKSGAETAGGSDGLPSQTVLPLFPKGAKPMGGYSFTPKNPRVSMARLTKRVASPVPLASSVIVSRKGRKGHEAVHAASN